nr:uncharacterized protein LOC109429670 [Aedes albopictus]
MKQALKLECASRKSETGCFETVRNIFDRVSNKPEHQDAAKHIRYKSVATTMRKARTSCFPLSPKTPDEFHRLMTTEKAAGFRTIYGEQFYHGYDGNTLYFVVPETMKAIEKAESTVLFLDGTFKTKPVMFNQLFMAYAQVYGKVFPLAFMPSAGSMKTDTYISILNKIRTLIAPGKVKTIVTDFEKALMQACRTVYPEATLQGCLFHYKQAVRRKIIKLGISQNSETYFEYRLAMQLAYLPANKIATSIDFVINKIKQNTADDTTAEIFGQYLWSQWVCSVAPEIYSVYKVPTTTNNAAESYHAKMLSEIGCSPTPWAFVEKIILLAKNVNLEIGRAQNLPFKRQQTERQRLVDELTTIYDATGDAQQFLLALNGSSKTMELGRFPSPASSAETVEALEECVSCGNTANYSLTPCRHRAYCSTCVWDDMRENPNCPICKTTWTGIKKDFELRPSGLLVCAPVLTTATQAAINIEAQRRHAPVPDTYRLPPSSSGASSLELPAPVYGTAGYSSPLPDIPLPIVPHKEYGVPVQNFGPPNTNIEYGSSAPAL